MKLRRERLERLGQAVKRFERYKNDSLWDHQNSAITALNMFFNEGLERIATGKTASGAIVMPTGSGKTALAAEMAKALQLRTLVLSPTIQIALQHHEELTGRGVDASLYYGGEKDLGGQVISTTYDSAFSLFKAGKLPHFDIAIYDEAHNSLSEKRGQMHGRIAPVEVGLTATPAYNSTRHVLNAFDSIIYEMGIQEAIEMGVLSPLRGFVIDTTVNVRGIRFRKGNDIDDAVAARYLNVLARNEAATRFYTENFPGVPAVAFCLTREHAEDFAVHLRKNGVKATFVHGGQRTSTRRRILDAFEEGKIDVITSRDVLIQGWDSQRLILELNLRPTYSRVVKTHMVGRVARYRPKKEAGIVVDFQDQYDRSQQPLLVHHLFDQITYRQGGLVAAPRKKKEWEEKRLSKKQPVKVHGKLDVSYNVREVVRVDESDSDFTDRKLLREIFATRDDIDFRAIKPKDFFGIMFSHPLFHGTGNMLMCKAFGIRHTIQSRLRLAEDAQNFLNYVFGDRFAKDTRLIEELDTAGLAVGEGIHLETPDELADAYRLRGMIGETLGALDQEEEHVLKMHFGIGCREHTLEEIGEHFELKRWAVQRKEANALGEIKHSLKKYCVEKRETPEDELRAILKDQASPSHMKQHAREELIAFSLGRSGGAQIFLNMFLTSENTSDRAKEKAVRAISERWERLRHLDWGAAAEYIEMADAFSNEKVPDCAKKHLRETLRKYAPDVAGGSRGSENLVLLAKIATSQAVDDDMRGKAGVRMVDIHRGDGNYQGVMDVSTRAGYTEEVETYATVVSRLMRHLRISAEENSFYQKTRDRCSEWLAY